MKKQKRRCNKLFYFSLFFLMPMLAFSQVSKFGYGKYVNTDGDSLLYRIVHPDYQTSAKYPLLVFLHGAGERGNDNEAQLKWGVQNFTTDEMMVSHPAIVVAPQCPLGEGWASYSRLRGDQPLKMNAEPGKNMKLLIGLIRELIEKDQVDKNRIYITGLSMGGLGTFDAISRYPELFAAAVPVAGGGDPAMAEKIKNVPLWIIHGANDPTVNPKYSRDVVQALWKIGAHPGYTELPDTGHFSWLGAYSDQKVIDWMFHQHK